MWNSWNSNGLGSLGAGPTTQPSAPAAPVAASFNLKDFTAALPSVANSIASVISATKKAPKVQQVVQAQQPRLMQSSTLDQGGNGLGIDNKTLLIGGGLVLALILLKNK